MKTKQYLLVTVVGVSLFAALMNLSAVLGVARKLISLVLPIIAGSILALFINVPMNGIKKQFRKVFHRAKKQPLDKLIHILSFVLTLCLALLVLFAVLTLLLPEIVRSTRNLYDQIKTDIPQWLAYLDAQQINAEWLEELLSDIDEKQMMEHITQGGGRTASQCGKRPYLHRQRIDDGGVCGDYLHLYDVRKRESMPSRKKAGVRLSETRLGKRHPPFLSGFPEVFYEISYRTMHRGSHSRYAHVCGL